MIRFFASPQDVTAASIALSEEDAEHIRSLRLRPSELFTVCDGKGVDYICRLGERSDNTIAEIVSRHTSLGEPSIACKVYIAYTKGDRMDYAVQKSVELGASEIVLYESERCVAVPRDLPKKTMRLQRIAMETAKQCNRGAIPKVTSGGGFDSVVNNATTSSALSLLFYEDEQNQSIKQVLEQHFPTLREFEQYETTSVSIITGPEGGFEPSEVKLAQSKDINIVSLGSRILRAETAPVVALASIMYHTGNL